MNQSKIVKIHEDIFKFYANEKKYLEVENEGLTELIYDFIQENGLSEKFYNFLVKNKENYSCDIDFLILDYKS